MKHIYWYLLPFVLWVTFACNPAKKIAGPADDGKLQAIFIQVNDVYEIDSLKSSGLGGLARIAALRNQYRLQNPNSFLVLAGDFLSPSVFINLSDHGKRIPGKQMIDVMNTAGFDFVIFGNHEFDIREQELQDRINESNFAWISSNAFHVNAGIIEPFAKIKGKDTSFFPLFRILDLTDADGTRAKLGIIGITLPYNKPPHVAYTEAFKTAHSLYDQLIQSCDAVIAITHQEMESDIELARQLPGLAVIMGGHEHSGLASKTGNVYITKGISNAKTAYIIKINIDKKAKTTLVDTALQVIDRRVPIDLPTDKVVQHWMHLIYDSTRAWGFDPAVQLIERGDSLEARDLYTRNGSTNFTRMIVKAMEAACPEAAAAILNSGSIRVDDVLEPPLTQYDILRSLPYRGPLREADMKGSLLVSILDAGLKNINSGGFLQYSESIRFNSNTQTWTLNGNPVQADAVYRVCLSDYLLSGKEKNLGFLQAGNPGIVRNYPVAADRIDPRSDICLAIIQYLKQHKNY